MLKDLFVTVLHSYLKDKEAYYALPTPRNFDNLASAVTLTGSLPKNLKIACNLNDQYIIKGSSGRPRIPEIPHVCILDTDITTTPTDGYYIVYLFDSALSKICLSLNQGWTQYREEFKKEAKEKIEQNTKIAQQLLRSKQGFSIDPINLNTKGRLGVGYELGNICSVTYERDSLPDDTILIDDLRNLLGVYRELKGLVGNSMLKITEKAKQLALEYKSDQSIVNDAPWIADGYDPPVSSESLENVLNLFSLSPYSPEFQGTYLTNNSGTNPVGDRKHGIIANTLAQILQSKGFKIFNDQHRDLVTEDLEGAKKLFEIKTDSCSQQIYKGIGQLLVYSIPFAKLGEVIDLILVLPENAIKVDLENGILARGIKILWYGWKDETPLFKNLDNLALGNQA